MQQFHAEGALLVRDASFDARIVTGSTITIDEGGECNYMDENDDGREEDATMERRTNNDDPTNFPFEVGDEDAGGDQVEHNACGGCGGSAGICTVDKDFDGS